jgi:hypothetical protein
MFAYDPKALLTIAQLNGYAVLGVFLGNSAGFRGWSAGSTPAEDAAGDTNIVVALQKTQDKPFQKGATKPPPKRKTKTTAKKISEPESAELPGVVETALSPDVYPLTRFVTLGGKPPARTRIILPVWGEMFTRNFVEFSLRQQVRSGMLAFETPDNLEYVVITDAAGVKVIKASAEFAELRKFAQVRFILNDHLASLSAYNRLTESYNLAVQSASIGDFLIFITSDCFFSREVFRRISELGQTHRVIMSPALRVTEETFITEVNMTGAHDIDGRAALALAMRHEHPLTEAFCVNNKRGVVHPQPAQTIYRLDDGYVGRWNVMHPIAIRVANPMQQIVATIDYNYPLFHLRSWSDVAVLDRIDDGLVVSLTPFSYNQGEDFARGNSAAAHVKNLKAWATNPWPLNFHIAQVNHPVRLVIDEARSSAEVAAGEKAVARISDRFVSYVASRKMGPHAGFDNMSALELFRPAIEQRQKRVLFGRHLSKALKRKMVTLRNRVVKLMS